MTSRPFTIDDQGPTPPSLENAGKLSGVLNNQYILYRFASSVFENPKVGLLSAFFLSINPAHIWLTGTPLSEMPNAMLLLAAIWTFRLYLKKSRPVYLFTTAFVLALANGLRFEFWLISILFSLIVLVQCLLEFIKRSARVRRSINLVIAALIPWIFPIGWLIGNYAETQNPFYSLQAIKAYKFQWYSNDTSQVYCRICQQWEISRIARCPIRLVSALIFAHFISLRRVYNRDMQLASKRISCCRP